MAILTTCVGNGNSSRPIIPTPRTITSILMSRSRRTPPKSDPWAILTSRTCGSGCSRPLRCTGTGAEESWTHSSYTCCHQLHFSSTSSGISRWASSYSLLSHSASSILACAIGAWIQTSRNHSSGTWYSKMKSLTNCSSPKPSTSSITILSSTRASPMQPNSQNTKINYGGSSTLMPCSPLASSSSEMSNPEPPWPSR